ncbi:MAG: HDOD domain-containing protein [Burkholderiales bacterium]|nr:HDOD domain-containing protein [Nitrosomonas sp.]MCP5275024.1 HDOD domain-containing protein [Burkholderiales bacterium]
MQEKDLSKISSDQSISAESGDQNNQEISVEDGLLSAVRNDSDLPALGASISRIVQLSSSDDESVRKLAYFVLSDVSLTQKILRLSNSVSFRTVSNKAITSISKAIFLLGFNTVKACALAILLVDGMAGKNARHVRYELICALAASMVGRELARYSYFKDAEEIAVAALFKNVGRLLLAAYYPDQYQEMMALIKRGKHTTAQASKKVLNFNLDDFAENILNEWEIPASIIKALKTQSVSELKLPKNKTEWMQQAVELSDKAVPLVLGSAESWDIDIENTILTRFGKTLNLDKTKLNKLIIDASKETNTLEINAELISQHEKKEIGMSAAKFELQSQQEEELLKELVFEFEDKDAQEYSKIQCYPSGKPLNATELLLTGIQDVTEVMASGKYKLSDLITLVLETFYNSLGFRFITLCLRDLEHGQYRARSSLGSNFSARQKAFVFPITASTDLFHLAMKNNVDLIISDASTTKVRNLLPKWHVDLLPDARSFIVLPLVVNSKRIGFFYADRQQEAPEGVSSEEMRLIKTLKAQVLTALNTR